MHEPDLAARVSSSGERTGGSATPPAAWMATLRESGLERRDREARVPARLGRRDAPGNEDDTDPAVGLYDRDGRVTWRSP